MEITQNAAHLKRLWHSIEVNLEYGYFGDYPPARITCYSDGDLEFNVMASAGFIPMEKDIDDRDHTVSKKSLAKLDVLVAEIDAVDCVEGEMIMDGPSFDCRILLSNGKVTGFHYCSIWPSKKITLLENTLRKTLREDFFLKKYKKEFGN